MSEEPRKTAPKPHSLVSNSSNLINSKIKEHSMEQRVLSMKLSNVAIVDRSNGKIRVARQKPITQTQSEFEHKQEPVKLEKENRKPQPVPSIANILNTHNTLNYRYNPPAAPQYYLYEQTPIGPSIHLNLNSMISIKLSKSATDTFNAHQIRIKILSESGIMKTHGFFLGNRTSSAIAINRFDKGKESNVGPIPVGKLDGDIVIPITNDLDFVNQLEFFKSDWYAHGCLLQPYLILAQTNGTEIHFISILPDFHLNLVPINPIRLIHNELCDKLLVGELYPKAGLFFYLHSLLAIDQSRQVYFMTETDEYLDIPVAGVWFITDATESHELCLAINRVLTNKRLKRLDTRKNTLLICVFQPALPSQPLFYECHYKMDESKTWPFKVIKSIDGEEWLEEQVFDNNSFKSSWNEIMGFYLFDLTIAHNKNDKEESKAPSNILKSTEIPLDFPEKELDKKTKMPEKNEQKQTAEPIIEDTRHWNIPWQYQMPIPANVYMPLVPIYPGPSWNPAQFQPVQGIYQPYLNYMGQHNEFRGNGQPHPANIKYPNSFHGYNGANQPFYAGNQNDTCRNCINKHCGSENGPNRSLSNNQLFEKDPHCSLSNNQLFENGPNRSLSNNQLFEKDPENEKTINSKSILQASKPTCISVAVNTSVCSPQSDSYNLSKGTNTSLILEQFPKSVANDPMIPKTNVKTNNPNASINLQEIEHSSHSQDPMIPRSKKTNFKTNNPTASINLQEIEHPSLSELSEIVFETHRNHSFLPIAETSIIDEDISFAQSVIENLVESAEQSFMFRPKDANEECEQTMLFAQKQR